MFEMGRKRHFIIDRHATDISLHSCFLLTYTEPIDVRFGGLGFLDALPKNVRYAFEPAISDGIFFPREGQELAESVGSQSRR
jgi:hypothetical protein